MLNFAQSFGPFDASDFKLIRARQHLKDLAFEVFHLADPARPRPQPRSAGIDDHLEASKADWYETFIRPALLALILGDAVHNLRSALDHMAVDAVALNGGNTKNVYFPFAEDANGLEEQIKKKNFDRASAAALKELRALKPYKGGNVALRGLHDLDVTDKHKLIIPAAYEKSAALYYGKEPRPEFPEDFCPKCDTNVDYRDKSATICWRGSLTFDSTSPFAGDEVVPTLHRLTDKVAAIINNFRAVLSP